MSSAEEAAFVQNPTNVRHTSWAYQDAKHGRMFVVNRGRGFGFLRCDCGFATVLKNPFEHKKKLQNQGHRTPYDLPCTLKKFTVEDLAHEFRTDVLQIRIDDPILAPSDLSNDERVGWLNAFVRTLSEAVRLACAQLLGIDQRELSATVRNRMFQHPEVILFDGVPGGAGYCRMLLVRHSMREILMTTLRILACPAECSYSCRVCLQDYDNQIHWEKLNRKPVLTWLAKLLAETGPANVVA